MAVLVNTRSRYQENLPEAMALLRYDLLRLVPDTFDEQPPAIQLQVR
jgi:hypothetical protein